MNKDIEYMLIALEEAKIAFRENEVPIGAVLVCNDKVIATNHNKKETLKQASAHAEILVINDGCKYKNDWRLDDCTLYVTVEPCLMCCGAIIQSRIKRLVYGTLNDKFGCVESIDTTLNNAKANHKVEVTKGICKKESTELLKKFFDNKRKIKG